MSEDLKYLIELIKGIGTLITNEFEIKTIIF